MTGRQRWRYTGHRPPPTGCVTAIIESKVDLGRLSRVQPYLTCLHSHAPGQPGTVTRDELHRYHARIIHLFMHDGLGAGLCLAIDPGNPAKHVIKRHQREGESEHANQRRYRPPYRAAYALLLLLLLAVTHASLLAWSQAGALMPHHARSRLSVPDVGNPVVSQRCATVPGWARSTPGHRQTRPTPGPVPSCRCRVHTSPPPL